MPLLIYKKKFFSGHFEDFFVNRVDFGHTAYLVKLLHLWPCQPQLLIFFNTHGKMKMGQIRANLRMPNMVFHLHCNSESGGWPHAQRGGAEAKNIVRVLSTHIVGPWAKVRKKSKKWWFSTFS